MKTHICIQAPTHHGSPMASGLKKGDYVTKIGDIHSNTVHGGAGYILEGYPGWTFSAVIFLPLPPPEVTEKKVYIEVAQTIKESVPETSLN